MIHLWTIHVDGVPHAVIPSMNESGAINTFFLKHGSGSRYSGIGYDQITAVRM